MPTVAVLPVKSFRLGKGRMAGQLTPEARSDLGRRLAERTADLAIASDLLPIIVAGDSEVATWAVDVGLPSLPDPGLGLNEAAAVGAEWADQADSNWVVIHTDLPLLVSDELGELTAALRRFGSAIAPSADGGTSALGGKGRPGFCYGPGSFRRHLARFPDAGVVTRVGLLHDVDSYSDLEAALRHPRGRWLG
ncbi:MAG TPA: NTP transferase domain-containing protein [Acidimicrobiia bacterium]